MDEENKAPRYKVPSPKSHSRLNIKLQSLRFVLSQNILYKVKSQMDFLHWVMCLASVCSALSLLISVFKGLKRRDKQQHQWWQTAAHCHCYEMGQPFCGCVLDALGWLSRHLCTAGRMLTSHMQKITAEPGISSALLADSGVCSLTSQGNAELAPLPARDSHPVWLGPGFFRRLENKAPSFLSEGLHQGNVQVWEPKANSLDTCYFHLILFKIPSNLVYIDLILALMGPS